MRFSAVQKRDTAGASLPHPRCLPPPNFTSWVRCFAQQHGFSTYLQQKRSQRLLLNHSLAAGGDVGLLDFIIGRFLCSKREKGRFSQKNHNFTTAIFPKINRILTAGLHISCHQCVMCIKRLQHFHVIAQPCEGEKLEGRYNVISNPNKIKALIRSRSSTGRKKKKSSQAQDWRNRNPTSTF